MALRHAARALLRGGVIVRRAPLRSLSGGGGGGAGSGQGGAREGVDLLKPLASLARTARRARTPGALEAAETERAGQRGREDEKQELQVCARGRSCRSVAA